MIEDVLPCSPSEWRFYLETCWWPTVKAQNGKGEYAYWRQRASVRMGKFKVVKSEGQEVIE